MQLVIFVHRYNSSVSVKFETIKYTRQRNVNFDSIKPTKEKLTLQEKKTDRQRDKNRVGKKKKKIYASQLNVKLESIIEPTSDKLTYKEEREKQMDRKTEE